MVAREPERQPRKPKKLKRPQKTVCWPCTLGVHGGCTGCSCRH